MSTKKQEIKQVISNSYYSAKPRVIFLSSPMNRLRGKDPISKYKQSIEKFCKMINKENKSVRVVNASKISAMQNT